MVSVLQEERGSALNYIDDFDGVVTDEHMASHHFSLLRACCSAWASGRPCTRHEATHANPNNDMTAVALQHSGYDAVRPMREDAGRGVGYKCMINLNQLRTLL